jgi:hypothetical protein
MAWYYNADRFGQLRENLKLREFDDLLRLDFTGHEVYDFLFAFDVFDLRVLAFRLVRRPRRDGDERQSGHGYTDVIMGHFSHLHPHNYNLKPRGGQRR